MYLFAGGRSNVVARRPAFFTPLTWALLIAFVVLAAIAPKARGLGFTDEAQLPQTGVVGKAFRFQLAGRNGLLPYTYKRDSGELPPGLALSQEGLILGRPTTTGTFRYWANLTDVSGRHSERLLTITIAPVSGTNAAGTGSETPEEWEKPGWTLTYFNEFTSRWLDEGRWVPCYQGYRSLPANYTITNGRLRVRIDRDAPSSPGIAAAPIPTRMRPENKRRVSSVETQAFFMQQYGLFEVRARTPKGRGVCSAFWLSPALAYEKLKADGGTRASAAEATEIDVFEQLGREPGTAHFAVHFGQGPGAPDQVERRKVALGFAPADDFHVYALQWNEQTLLWYVDGKEVHRSDKAPHAPFFLRLSVFEEEGARGLAEPSPAYPQDLEVDYVRVYR